MSLLPIWIVDFLGEATVLCTLSVYYFFHRLLVRSRHFRKINIIRSTTSQFITTFEDSLSHNCLIPLEHHSRIDIKMHCNSLLVVVSSLIAIATALPPPQPVLTQKARTSTEATTANQHATAKQEMATLGDFMVEGTIIEDRVFPPHHNKYSTILDWHSSSTSSKASTTSKPPKTAKVVPTNVAPSTCTTYYPTIMRQLSEAFPDVMQENTANTTRAFHVAQAVSFADKIKFNRIQQYVVFNNITAGSWDCQLMVSWPDAQHGGLKVTSSSRRGSSATSGVSLDVYSASYNASAYVSLASPQFAHKNTPNNNGPFSTWDSMMSAIKVGGNNQLSVSDREKGQDKSAVSTDAKISFFGTVGVNPGEYGLTINSEACPSSTSDTLGFLFEIPATDSRDASVSFLADKENGAGIYLLTNC